MPLNRKEERALTDALAAARQEARFARALRWSHPQVEMLAPDVPPPMSGSGNWNRVTTGWSFNAYTATVTEGWSTSVSHGDGKHDPSGLISGSQGSLSLYSSRALALRALRVALERKYAAVLATIDAEIDLASREIP